MSLPISPPFPFQIISIDESPERRKSPEPIACVIPNLFDKDLSDEMPNIIERVGKR